MIRAVVFDLDGTIVTFSLNYKALRAEVRGLLIKQGVPASVLSLSESIFEMLDKTEIFMRNSGKQEALGKIRDQVFKIAEIYEFEAAKSVSLSKGVVEVLKTLRDMNLKIGLCTVSGEKTVNYILEKFRIKEFFDAVTSREMVGKVKPHGEHLQATLKALNVKAEEALVVGDSVADVRCARDVGAIAVGFPAGISTDEELIKAGANYIVTSITDVPVLAERLKASSS
ncbi:MAG: HAD family hydrolase [Candidatus Bathyarchaeota archaeon]|nr:HAD family hydrolase [Candidatus Bathyarchaeota archaeon]